MEIKEIDMTNPDLIMITGIIRGGKCPVCGEPLGKTPEEALAHFDGECKKGLKQVITKSIKEIDDVQES